MYNSGYAGAKLGLQAGRKLQKSRGNSCGYYLRLIFFFSSLIQTLIIVGLVLFLVYGKSQDSASEVRIQDLEKSFNRLTTSNAYLREQRENLTRALNISLAERRRMDRSLFNLTQLTSISHNAIQYLNGKQSQCEMEKMKCLRSSMTPCMPSMPPLGTGSQASMGDKGAQMKYLQQQLQMVQTNFSQISQALQRDLDSAIQDRNRYNVQLINKTRDYDFLQTKMNLYHEKCKVDFIQSLSGIGNVSKAFLKKVDALAWEIPRFHLSCDQQRSNMIQIRNNCTTLSRQIENTFQPYLNELSYRVRQIQLENSGLQAENRQLFEDNRSCQQKRSELAQEHAQTLRTTREREDRQKEKMIQEQDQLRGDRDLQQRLVSVKNSQIDMLKESVRTLNASLARCNPKFTSAGSTSQFGVGAAGAGSSFIPSITSRGSATGSNGASSSSGSSVVNGRGGGPYGGGGASSYGGGGASPYGSTGVGGASSPYGRAGTAASSGTASSSGWPPSSGARPGATNNFSPLSINQLLKDLQRYGTQPASQPAGQPANQPTNQLF